MLVKRVAPSADHGFDAVFRIPGAAAVQKMQVRHPVEFSLFGKPPFTDVKPDPVLAGIGGDAPSADADAAREHRQQRQCPALEVPVIPLVVGGPVHDVQRGPCGRLHGDALDGSGRGSGDL